MEHAMHILYENGGFKTLSYGTGGWTPLCGFGLVALWYMATWAVDDQWKVSEISQFFEYVKKL
jgi:hypothetical protein